MERNFYICIFILFFMIGSIAETQAQCDIENKYFDAGEQLQYDLYIKLGLATTKGGYAKLNTTSVTYQGQSAYKMSMISESQGLARKLFSLSDTLVSYTTKNLRPLAYEKDAHEGGDYTRERLSYSYSGNNINIKTIRHKEGKLKFDETLSGIGCTYDLVSIMFYCRTLDYTDMKKGSETKVNFISGKKMGNMRIVYDGKEQVKGNDNKKYNCIKLVLYVADEAFDNGKEAMKVYISDDDNRMPIRLETKLKVGSTRAVIKSYTGNKYPLNTSK